MILPTHLRGCVLDTIREHRLPGSFLATVASCYLPLAGHLAGKYRQDPPFRVVGVNGAQGTGKSTLADFLRILLQKEWGLTSVVLSIDDIYLTRAERQRLGQEVHPLLETRGVPGTHDLQLGVDTISSLLAAEEHDETHVPRFDKAIDDRIAKNDWPRQRGRCDIVILEGWCVGARPQPSDELLRPVNRLEREEDSDGRWRRYVNERLAEYQRLFALLNMLVMLQAPSMECVQNWRTLQEEKLIRARGGRGEGLMDKAQISRFIQHYERLTRYMLIEMPQRADCVLHLDQEHIIRATSCPSVAGMK